MKLVDLKLSKKERENFLGGPLDKAPEDDYPWGMRLHLDKTEIEKLGIKGVKVGDTVALVAKCKVTDKHESESTEGSHASVSMQITAAEASIEKKEEVSAQDFLQGVFNK